MMDYVTRQYKNKHSATDTKDYNSYTLFAFVPGLTVTKIDDAKSDYFE